MVTVLTTQGQTLPLATSLVRGTGILLIQGSVGHSKGVMAHFKANVLCAKKNILFPDVLS